MLKNNSVRVLTAALVLVLAVTPSAFAKGGPDKGHDDDDRRAIPDCRRDHDGDDDHGRGGDDKLTCPNKQVVVRIDDKLCPEKPGRPAVIRQRVCCRHGETTNCRPFRPCPPRSRS